MKTEIDKRKGLSFDSSLSAIDSAVSPEEYRQSLIVLLQPILEKRFPGNVGKQKIRDYRDRITFSCPYCGDSMKSDYKKRGNFILNGKFANFFKCHNCGEFKRIDKFFSDFKVDLELNVINYIAKNIEDFSIHSNVKYDMSLFLDMDSVEKYAIDRQEFLNFFRLTEVKGTSVWSWLNRRLQYDDSKFMYNPSKNYLLILNLTPSGKILGTQRRNFKGENKYMTYRIVKLYELMKRNVEAIPDEIDVISQIFNISLIDYTKPVTLFEGAFDSFLFKNSLGNAGANKSFPFDINYRAFFDYDKTGIEKSVEKINEGIKVFLWTKFLNDINAPYRKKWDLNDILIWAKENNIVIPNLENYFSNNPLDIIDV